jgi:hypothetical protein
MSEQVAKRLLDHCLSDWKRHAVKLRHENAGVAFEQVRKRIKWYMPLAHFSACAYFDYCDSRHLAQLWDSMAVCERAEWLITQLRNSNDCPNCIQYVWTHFDIAQGSTYSEVVAELAEDLERPHPNWEMCMDKSA